MKKRLAIITTHPVQYNAPMFKKLNSRGNIALKVFYTWGPAGVENVYDPGFGLNRSWDIPLLEGYEYCLALNKASKPGSHSFWSIQNPTLIQDIKQYEPDAILIYGWNFFSHIKVMRFFKGKIKILFRGDSTLLDEAKRFSLRKAARRIFLKAVYKNVDVALYCGENNRRYFLTHGVKSNNLKYVPHCVDNQRFSEADLNFCSEAALEKKKMGISSSDLVFLFAGKLEHKKNVELLIKAFLALPILNKRLIIVGNGPLEGRLKRLAKGIEGVTFLPFHNQSLMPIIYRLADVFVLPSQGPAETWGLALNEAMASGVAVIASDKCGGAIDLIDPGKNGYIFESGDLDSLCEKMRLLSTKQATAEFGKRSKEIIKEFSFEKASEAIENII